jgi:hypothetical protein
VTDRVASDADAVTTHRAELARSGGTHRPCLRLPEAARFDTGDLIRLVLGGDTYHARVESDAGGRLLRGAYDNRRLARSDGDTGENRLVEWVRSVDLQAGDAVEMDEVTPGYLYGARVPGRRTIYAVTRQPDASLADIAESIDSDG